MIETIGKVFIIVVMGIMALGDGYLVYDIIRDSRK